MEPGLQGMDTGKRSESYADTKPDTKTLGSRHKSVEKLL
jgi:hypothetical protein